jgi:recombination protein RecR
MLKSPRFDELVAKFSSLPGIGKKTAQRLAWHLLSIPKEKALELSTAIQNAVESYTTCSICCMLTEENPCTLCTSPERDDSQLCVVESHSDVFTLESMNEYRGRYYVLGHLLSPLDGYGPDALGIPGLLKRIEELQPEELILALKPSAEGEATIHYLTEMLQDHELNITRLSVGLPFGGDLEYSGALTLANAFKRRFPA